MGRTLRTIILLFVGTLAGFITAQRSIESRGRSVAETGWRTWQGDDADPYALAHFLDSGVLPPDGSQWSVYEAFADSKGNALDADCIYRIRGKIPQSRWWRISAEGAYPSTELPAHSWLQSSGVIYESDGSVNIAIAPVPQPGNWMMLPDVSSLKLLVYILERQDTAAPLPAIEQVSCS
jgi:hypothetical protein